MLVTEKVLRKSLQKERTADKDASALATALVAAAAQLQPLLWDPVLGYGNPRREVIATDYDRAVIVPSSHG